MSEDLYGLSSSELADWRLYADRQPDSVIRNKIHELLNAYSERVTNAEKIEEAQHAARRVKDWITEIAAPRLKKRKKGAFPAEGENLGITDALEDLTSIIDWKWEFEQRSTKIIVDYNKETPNGDPAAPEIRNRSEGQTGDQQTDLGSDDGTRTDVPRSDPDSGGGDRDTHQVRNPDGAAPGRSGQEGGRSVVVAIKLDNRLANETAALDSRITHLRALKSNWDHDGGHPPQVGTIDAAEALAKFLVGIGLWIPVCNIGPTSDGDILFSLFSPPNALPERRADIWIEENGTVFTLVAGGASAPVSTDRLYQLRDWLNEGTIRK